MALKAMWRAAGAWVLWLGCGAAAWAQVPAGLSACTELNAPPLAQARAVCTEHPGCALLLSAQQKCPVAVQLLERLARRPVAAPLTMEEILDAYLPALNNEERLLSAIRAAKAAARGAATAPGLHKSAFLSGGRTFYFEGGRDGTKWSGPGFMVYPSGLLVLGNYGNGALEGAGMSVGRFGDVLAGQWSAGRPAGHMVVQTSRGEMIVSDNVWLREKVGALERLAEKNGWSHLEEVAGENQYLVRSKSDAPGLPLRAAPPLAPADALTVLASNSVGMPRAEPSPGERYQHSNCGLASSPHAAMYQRCLAHTGCEIVARKLFACNQTVALMDGLSKRLGARTDITNFDLFELLQPKPTKHERLIRYIEATRAAAYAEPDAPAWRVMRWGQRDAQSHKQVFTYFEGRATLLPGNAVAKSTGSTMALGRGVAINEYGYMMRGDFKEGQLHGIGQTLSVSPQGVDMRLERLRNGITMGLSIHQRVGGEVSESMMYPTDSTGLNFKESGILRYSNRDGGGAMSLHRGRNDSAYFPNLSGRIDPFKPAQPSGPARTPQLTGSGGKP